MPRNWYENPGQDGSFWVTPFYTTAQWITSGAQITALRNGKNSTPTGTINTGTNFAAPFYIGHSTDPVVKVTDGTTAGTINVHMPLGAVIESPNPSAGNQNVGGTDATQPYLVWSAQDATFASGTSVAASGTVINTPELIIFDGSGPVMMDVVTNTTFPAANSFGLIQDFELQQALASSSYVIPHMLAYTLDASQVSSSASPVWPLSTVDTSITNTGILPQGQTVGIPASTTRPTGMSRGFYLLWDCFQQFGGFFYNIGLPGSINLTVFSQRTDSATTGLIADIQNSWSSVVANLCILANQTGTTSIKGFVSGASPAAQFAFPPPPVLDLSPTNGYELPSKFGAWYATGRANYYNALGPLTVPLPTGAFALSLTVTVPTGIQPNTSFTVTGTLTNYNVVPTLSYQDDGGTAQAFPGGSTVSLTSFSFTHPGMPSGSHTLVVTDGTVTGSASYTIGSSGFTSLPPVTATTNTVAGLQPNTAYDFEVFGTNVVGQGPTSSILTVATTSAAVIAPTAPTGLTSTTVGTTSVNLTWTAPTTGSQPLSYQPQFSISGQNSFSNGPTVNATSAQITGLTAGTAYDFRVSASNSAGTSPFSGTFTTSTLTAAPTVTFATPSANITLSNNNLTATSTGSSTAYSSRGGVTSTTSHTTGKWAVQFTLSTITQNLSVGLCNSLYTTANGNLGGDANGIGFYPSTGVGSQPALTVFNSNRQILTPSGTPAGDTNGAVCTMLLDVDAGLAWWQTPAMVTAFGSGAYNDSATSNPGAGTGGLSIGVTGALFFVMSASEGGDVVTVNAGSSAFVGTVPSNFPAWNSATQTVTAPGQVTGLTTGSPTSSSVSLSWSIPTGTAPFTYTVQFRVTGSGLGFTTFGTTNNVTSDVVTGLNLSTQYDFQVFASNSAGTGTTSAIVTGTTTAAAQVPGQVIGVQATNPTISAITLSWQAPTSGGAVSNYIIQQKLHIASTFLTVLSVSAATFTATFTGLQSNTAYDFQVFASNASGSGPPSSPPVSATTTAVTTTPGPATGLSATSPTPVEVDLTFTLPATGGTLDNGVIQILQATTGGFSNGPTVPYCTTGSGSFSDGQGNTIAISVGGLVTVNNVPVTNTANVIFVCQIGSILWQQNTALNWYSTTVPPL